MANNDEIRFISSSIKLPPFSSSHSLHSPISFLKHTPRCNFAKLPFNFSFNFDPQPINFISQFVQNQPFLHYMFKKPPLFCSATLVLSDSEPGQSKSGDESGTVVQYKGDEFGPVIQSKNVGSTRTAEEERVLISEVLVRNKDGEELEPEDEVVPTIKAPTESSMQNINFTNVIPTYTPPHPPLNGPFEGDCDGDSTSSTPPSPLAGS